MIPDETAEVIRTYTLSVEGRNRDPTESALGTSEGFLARV